jgi:hypothetical protein
VAIIETLQRDMEPNDMELIAVDVVILCTKISIIKLPFEIVRIFVGYNYIKGVESQ